jgi:cell wall-associated NlpC family hydrolase
VALAPAGGNGSPLGAAALRIAETQRGVREIGGANRGPQVEEYLEAAQVAPGNPWCASFITWAMEKAGHKMPGGGWAAVATWVHNAEAGNNGLKVVSADEARPGDIVAYDFGGQSDFGADGHIGFLQSDVKGGQFTALEGNNHDAVNEVPRKLGDANIRFIRIEGNAAPGAVPPGYAAAAAPGAVAPAAGAPAGAAVPPPPVAEPIDPHKSGSFLSAKGAAEAKAEAAKPRSARESAAFLKAVAPEQPKAAADAVQPGAPPAAADAVVPAGDLSAVPDAYPGNDAPKAEIAAWMAKQAEARGLPRELPVMASLVESGLQNLSGGDRDSVGFFQMRVGIWNQGEYAGYPDKPELQVKWFLDQAEAVKKQRVANGQPIDDPKQYGEWIADVERPAEEFRGRYQLRLDEAHDLLGQAPQAPAADAAAPGQDAAALADAAPPPTLATAASPQALAAVKEAEKYLGTPYKYGGSSPQTGFDCSGLMQWAYAQSGIKIPRVTYTQIDAPNGTPVRRTELLPGDLVFFRDAGGDVHHVGMSLGGDKFIHAPHTGDVVKVSSLSESYYAQQFTGGRRFAAAVAGAPAAAPPAAPEVAAAAPAEAAAPAAPAAPAVDPRAVAEAKAAAARDAAEARRHGSAVFKAIEAQETRKENDRRNSMMFLKAIKPEEAKAAAEAAAPPAAAPPPVEPAPAAAAPAAPAAGPVSPEVAAAADAPASPDLAAVAAEYPGNDATQEQLAKWLAKQAEKHGLPPELPVMASLVESGVKNLNFGDRDSVGFFQMRTEIWNKGEYAGYPDHPELQIKWFIDHAVAIKKQRIAAGDADFGTDPSKWGEWIADVERPAEQFRGRYQLRLGEARELIA